MNGLQRIWIAMMVVVYVQLYQIYSTAPPVLATHFDFQGRANGWMGKEACVGFFALMNLGLNLFLLYIRRAPAESWLVRQANIPWKAYWFSTPERKKLGLQKLRVVLEGTGGFVNFVHAWALWIISHAAGLASGSPGIHSTERVVFFIAVAAFLAWVLKQTKPPRDQT